MKRILFVCCLLTATCVIPGQKAHAQTVSVGDFTTKVNQLDSLIGTGDMTLAQAKWNEVHAMMISELGVTKANIAAAGSGSTSATTYMNTMQSQYNIYKQAWDLKSDLSGNRAPLHVKLLAFAATF